MVSHLKRQDTDDTPQKAISGGISYTSEASRVSSILIRCPIYTALCHIWAKRLQRYPVKTMTDADYADDLALHVDMYILISNLAIIVFMC